MNRLALYSPLHGTRSQEFPSRPFVHAMVGACTQEYGHTLLSAQLMTDHEVDEFVIQMKADLDEFAQAAKRELYGLRKMR